MNNPQNTFRRKNVNKERTDYYITPTHDFTQYTRDSEEKYWSQETKFNWQQDVRENLVQNLENYDPENLYRVTFMVLPMIKVSIENKIAEIRQAQLPLDEDALKAIAECIPSDKTNIQEALLIVSPLKASEKELAKVKDQLEILQRELIDLREQQRLGLIREGTKVRQLESEAEGKDQALVITQLKDRIDQLQWDYKKLKAQSKGEMEHLKAKIRKALFIIEPRILADLEETRELLHRILDTKLLSTVPNELARIKDLILKRQLRGLKDIANHSLVVEQSAIAPLTMGLIHYKRHREIQEAMTTFVNDEAKHSATFRRFLVEKLGAKEFVSDTLIKGAERYMWIARLMPGAGMFLAVMVEAIGASYLEFFGKEEYMPDRLYSSICQTITDQDEARHLELCVGIYNELYRKGTWWERKRNYTAMKVMMKAVYGDKNDDHHLIQAFRAFGVDSAILYRHIALRLSQQLARVGMYLEPESFLEIVGRK